MIEIEIKFQVPAAQRAAVERAVGGRTPGRRLRLQAAYLETPERALAGAGLALRLRREGRAWVQTLKGAADDAMTRQEHNVPRGSGAAMPAVDPQLHAGTPVGERLLALLGADGVGALAVQYRTDILRRQRQLRVAGGQIELALDTGHIVAGDARLPVCELEIELRSGAPQVLLDVARQWSQRYGLWLDGRTKAERGDLLSRGLTQAPARWAVPLAMSRSMDGAAAWQLVLRSCADQILANASQIASGAWEAEHVHQLRVGLRRLRSALRLFDDAVPVGALADGATALFRDLGAARDRAVLDGTLSREVQSAWRAAQPAAAAGDAPDSPLQDAAGAPADLQPLHAVRGEGGQALLLGLLEAMQTEGPAGLSAKAWRQHVTRRLNRWHRVVVNEGALYATLDDVARHRLRKRAKRLRYACEFCAGLYEPRSVRRYLRALRVLQDRLGAFSDVAMACASVDRGPQASPQAWFALGWLTARRQHLIERAAPAFAALSAVRCFWK